MYMKAQSFDMNLIAFYLNVCILNLKYNLHLINITLKSFSIQNIVSFGKKMAELHNTTL